MSQIDLDRRYMQLALDEARKSPPKPTNFCVGAVIVSPSSDPPILATGYTLEEPGNTHAEQSAFIKLARKFRLEGSSIETKLGPHLPSDTVLYTTMEPCSKRSPGNTTCVERISMLRTSDGQPAIRRVCIGLSEPQTFVDTNTGRGTLQKAGIVFEVIQGFEEEITAVSTSGHNKEAADCPIT